MIFKQKTELFRQKKKDLSDKLEYIGIDKKEIDKMIKDNYNLFGILTGFYKIFEKDVNKSYEKLKKANEELEIERIKYQDHAKEFKKYLKNLN